MSIFVKDGEELSLIGLFKPKYTQRNAGCILF